MKSQGIQSKIGILLIAILCIAVAGWRYMDRGPYRQNEVKKIISDFNFAEQTADKTKEKRNPISLTTLPRQMPDDFTIIYYRGGGMNADEIEVYISPSTSTLEVEYEDGKKILKKTYTLALSKTEVEYVYGMARSHEFDEIQTKQSAENEIIQDDSATRIEIFYTQDGKKENHDIYVGQDSHVRDEYTEDWLAMSRLFSAIVKVYQ